MTTPTVDKTDKVFDRAAKLLAQAEQATTPGEHEAFMAKALEQAQALGIELEVLRARKRDMDKKEEPEERRYKVGSYSGYRVSADSKWMVNLFSAIADPHDVRLLISKHNIYVWGFGMPTDLSIVEAIFGICSVRMVAEADASIKRGDHHNVEVHGASRSWSATHIDGRVWRRHFYEGYVDGLRSRLYAARETARQKARDAGIEVEGTGVDIVLASKAKKVNEAYDQHLINKGITGTHKMADNDDYVPGAHRRGGQAAWETDLSLDPKLANKRPDAIA